MRKSLTKQEILRKRQEIVQVFECRQAFYNGPITLYYKKSTYSYTRVLFTVRSAINAVKRNLKKRWLREIYRTYKHKFVHPYDIIIQLRGNNNSFSVVQNSLVQLFQKIKRLRNI